MASRPDPTAASQRADLDTLFQAEVARHPNVRRWLIGHSGGLDSQVLLHLAARHIPRDRLLVVHVNHQLQAAADYWVQFCQRNAQRLKLAFHLETVSPVDRSEQAARDARYAAFEQLLQAGDCLLLGHHADDQAETLLFRLLRGSGLTGLGGMPRQRPLGAGQLLRPLLDQPKSVLLQWAETARLDWVEDPSNRQLDYDRNYLRNEVMPRLAQRWPGFSRRWSRTADQLRETEQLLNRLLDRELQPLLLEDGGFDCQSLAGRPDDEQRALLRRWLQPDGVLLNRDQLQRVIGQLVNARADAQPRLRLADRELRRYRQRLYLRPAKSLPIDPFDGPLQPGEQRLSDGRLQIAPGQGGLKTLQGLQLVRRQGGERLSPQGRGGSCSLKQLLQEAGIAPWWREHWPLIVSDGKIVAVPRICVCEGWWSATDGYRLNWQPF
ncbi:tRNA lysidine(34) synthetase TilS [Marinobacterium arenosum]|uniref:tRNA lysidine(34) synthetase TilS n=1 Tax=Marinobacterium arenosum TaxID=2862496 RepID=UPI001C96197F|nr:tRNA lysidine(34) synthetase TilS [Marinobacterium arenosum]MBY4675659.1 tRNA lysidine(34) synthetase TilS [Marinobacterium arenosum]